MSVTLNMSLTEAKSMASLINLADTSRNPVAPILGYIEATIDGNSIIAKATDRYVAGTGVHECLVLNGSDEGLISFYIDAIGAKFIKSQKPISRYDEQNEFQFMLLNGTLGISYGGASVTIQQPTAKFPPIGEMLLNFKPSEAMPMLSLNLNKIGQINKLEPLSTGNWIITPLEGSANKPGPVQFKNANMLAILQPNIIVER